MSRVTKGEHPINLVVQQVQRPLAAGALASRVLLNDQIADFGERVGIEQGAGRIQRRVEDQHPGAAKVALQHAGRRQKTRLRAANNHDLLGADELRVVVVVPRRHRKDHAIARVDEDAVRAVDRRPRAARDEHGADRVRDVLTPCIELTNRAAQRLDTVRGRVVRLAGLQRGRDTVEQRFRDAKLAGTEVADGKVADGLARCGEGANLGPDGKNERAGELLRDGRDSRGGRRCAG